MILTVIIAFLSLIALVVLHELGHFLLAKKFGVKVEEFGIGFPPRIYGKKIGETIYSLNLLPIGAFVKMPGENEQSSDPRAFCNQPVWKRALISFGGVASFWVAALLIFAAVLIIGAPTSISDNETENFRDVRVMIITVAKDSPAETAGIKMGDVIKKIKIKDQEIIIDKLGQVQDISKNYRGQEIKLTLQRGENLVDVFLTPRVSFPQDQGAMGIATERTGIKNYPLWQIPYWAGKATYNMTVFVVQSYAEIITKLVKEGKAEGVSLVGPVAVVYQSSQIFEIGLPYFLNFMAVLAILLAIFNLLPIPALDGGKLLFLAIEAIRQKPVSEKIESRITATFFILIIVLGIYITVKDIINLF